MPARVWRRLSAGDGTKGPRLYDWAYLPCGAPTARGFEQGLLNRRKIKQPAEFTFYLTLSPPGTMLAQLVRVAGTRWTVEVCFEAAKGEVGLDQYEVRRGPAGTATSPWRCWPMLISLPCARPPRGKKSEAATTIKLALRRELLPHTVPELRRQLWRLVWAPPPAPEHILAWSLWRRRHQQHARRCHWYRGRHLHKLRL